MNFCPDFATNSRKEWRLSLFHSNLRKQIRKLPKFLKFVKVIQYYSIIVYRVLRYYATANSCWPDEDYPLYFKQMQAAGWTNVERWDPFSFSTWASCDNWCCGRVGSFGEEFWNCADIRVLPSSDGGFTRDPHPGSNATAGTCTFELEPWSDCTGFVCEGATQTAPGRRSRSVTCYVFFEIRERTDFDGFCSNSHFF